MLREPRQGHVLLSVAGDRLKYVPQSTNEILSGTIGASATGLLMEVFLIIFLW